VADLKHTVVIGITTKGATRDAVLLCNGLITDREAQMTWRDNGPMNIRTLATLMLAVLFGYSAWLTSIVFCASNGLRALLIAGAIFFPVGIVHGVGVWFGGW
jgi:hypothetical protein